MKVLNIHLKNYDSQYNGKDLMSLEEVVLYMNGKYTPFSAKVFGINKELQPHFSEDTVEARIELKEKGSIFDNPRWVTSKTDMELSQGLELISGKDYKVVETIIDDDGDKLFKVVNSLGILRSYHEGHFHKVTPEDLKPVVDIEEKDSFDNLVYIQPRKWSYLDMGTISPEQRKFFKNNLNLFSEDTLDYKYITFDGEYWTGAGLRTITNLESKKISFNELFQEVTAHQD